MLEFRIWLENTITQAVKTDPKVIEIYKNLPKEFLQAFRLVPPAILEPLKKWIAYQMAYVDKTVMGHLLDKHILFNQEDKYNLKSKLNRLDYTLANLEQDNEKYHQDLQKNIDKIYYVRTEGLFSPVNGLVWVSLDKEYCERYGSSMGHCGNAARKDGDNILSLMDPKTNIHYLTFIVNRRVLGESKGRNNQKPLPKYMPNIKQLLLSPYIETIKGLGYKPENNFQFSDLDKKDQAEVLSVHPHMHNYVDFISPGEKYIYEDYNYIFSRKLSDEEFLELAHQMTPALNYPQEVVSVVAEFKRRGLPLSKEIYQKVLAKPMTSLFYTVQFLNPNNVTEDLIDSIAGDYETAASYAGEFLKGKNVPKQIMDTVHDGGLGIYVYFLLNNKVQITEDILKSLNTDFTAVIQLYERYKSYAHLDFVQVTEKQIIDILTPLNVLKLILQGNTAADYMIEKASEAPIEEIERAIKINERVIYNVSDKVLGEILKRGNGGLIVKILTKTEYGRHIDNSEWHDILKNLKLEEMQDADIVKLLERAMFMSNDDIDYSIILNYINSTFWTGSQELLHNVILKYIKRNQVIPEILMKNLPKLDSRFKKDIINNILFIIDNPMHPELKRREKEMAKAILQAFETEKNTKEYQNLDKLINKFSTGRKYEL